MPTSNDGIMVILSSPSGAGKTTLVNLLSKLDNFEISISHTTRLPRPNENQDKDSGHRFKSNDGSPFFGLVLVDTEKNIRGAGLHQSCFCAPYVVNFNPGGAKSKKFRGEISPLHPW